MATTFAEPVGNLKSACKIQTRQSQTPIAAMEEPTIYRARVNAYDNEPETLPSEENTFKSTTYVSTVGADTISDKDYDIFVIPEGW